MTAEIAVLNKHGVALAADSAVTIGENSKVYNSANKLFQLSKHHPIGIMIYGNAEFMGVPWEIIIKQYRNKLGSESFSTMEEYTSDFFKYLSSVNLGTDDKDPTHVAKTVKSYLHYIKGEIVEKINQVIEENGQVTTENTASIVKDIIQAEYTLWKKVELLPNFPKEFASNFVKENSKLIRAYIKEIFQNIPMDAGLRNKLLGITPELYCKNRFPSNTSGLVFAGYGNNEIFPKVRSFNVESRISTYVKYSYNSKKSESISGDNTAAVIPFAQSEMVATFMEGVDPRLGSFAANYLSSTFDKFPSAVLDRLNISDSKKRTKILDELNEVSKQLHDGYLQSMNRYRMQEHVNPIIEMVTVLPKDELALMAEALVNLTSFKRRITAVAETVGGPIDVAVISKGDGFIWITRKHYFKSELNHHFFSNYYCGGHDGTANKEERSVNNI